MTLDGLEASIDKAFRIKMRPDGCRKNNKYKIHLIRYADDFVVTASEKEILENKVKPLIEDLTDTSISNTTGSFTVTLIHSILAGIRISLNENTANVFTEF